MIIKLGTEKDIEYFKELILKDDDAYIKLGMTGVPDWSQKNDRWNICFFVPKKGMIRAYYNSDPPHVYICGVYVVKSARKQGIGKALMEEVIKFAHRCWNYCYITGDTLENPASEALFKSCRFRNVGTYEMVHRKNGKWISQTKWIKEGNI